MVSRNAKFFSEYKESNRSRRAQGHVQIYLEKTATTMRWCAFVIYLAYSALLNFVTEPRSYLIESSHTLVRFFSSVEDHLNDTDSAENSGNCNRLLVRADPEVKELEDVVSQTTIWKWCEEKLVALHQPMESMLNSLFECQDAGFLASSSDWRKWNLFPFVASHCCDYVEAVNRGIWHGTTSEWACIWFLAGSK